MRVGLFTREYPPQVYGGAGIHVEYLSREMAKDIEVEVHCWGPQQSDQGNLHVRGAEPWAEISNGTEGKFKGALEAFSLNLTQVKALRGIDIVHTHTWYVSMAGYLAKKLYDVPFVLTTHSLEPLRAWKAEQLGRGYAMSSWMEQTAILDADAIIAVSKGTKADILSAYPDVNPDRIHVIYNGIDLAEYQKTSETKALIDYGVDPSVPYVLFVGRITRQKGVTHLVDAISFLPPETQVVLCAGAPDTPEIAEELRNKVANARRNHPRIVWIEKMVTKQEAIQLYSNCRGVLLSVGVRALRHNQPRSHGLPCAGCRKRHGRHQRGSGRRRDRVSGAFRSGSCHQLSSRSDKVRKGSRVTHQPVASGSREVPALWRCGKATGRRDLQLDRDRQTDNRPLSSASSNKGRQAHSNNSRFDLRASGL